MSAFDTGTNTASATFTNSFATVSLLPSGSTQVAKGFYRGSGLRYFEAVVNSAGGAPGSLFIGLEEGSGLYSFGTADIPSLTASDGDVFMFAVNLEHEGTPSDISHSASTSVGTIAVGRNGVWAPAGGLIFARAGTTIAPGWRPVVRRTGTSTSAAQVTLRVLTASFSYQPSGYVQWGESGGVTTNTATAEPWGWEPTSATGFSLSGSNHFAVIGSITTGDSVFLSAPLPVRNFVYEVYAPYPALTTRTMRLGVKRANVYSFTADGGFFFLGFNSILTPIVASLSVTGTAFGFGSAPLTSVAGGKRYQFTRNASAGHIWASMANRNGFSFGTTPVFLTGGNPLFSISATSSIWAFLDTSNVGDGGSVTQRAWVINTGIVGGFFWPMPPGFESLDRTRRVLGGDTYWQMTPATSVTINNEVIAQMLAQKVARVSANKAHASGKRYFELNLGGTAGPGGTDGRAVIGLSRNGASSYTQTGSGALDQLLALQIASNGAYETRNGTTIAGLTITATQTVNYAFKALVAVDFDTGRIWFGRGTEVASWSGDPAAGTGAAISFTASTSLYPAVAFVCPSVSTSDVLAIAAFESGAFRFDPPSGFSAWSVPSTTTTATVTPSGVAVGKRVWPFGVHP